MHQAWKWSTQPWNLGLLVPKHSDLWSQPQRRKYQNICKTTQLKYFANINYNRTIMKQSMKTLRVEICQDTPAMRKMESLEISLPSRSPKILTNHGSRRVQTAWRVQCSKTRSHQRTTQSPKTLKLLKPTLAGLSLKAVFKPHQTWVSLSVYMAPGQDKTAK